MAGTVKATQYTFSKLIQSYFTSSLIQYSFGFCNISLEDKDDDDFPSVPYAFPFLFPSLLFKNQNRLSLRLLENVRESHLRCYLNYIRDGD